MMIKNIRSMLLAAVAVMACFSHVVLADDTDIYTTSAITPGEPFVMFMLDHSANLNSTATCDQSCKSTLGLTGNNFTQFDILRAALKTVLDPIAKMKVGFMVSHAQSPNCAGTDDTHCSNGAYVVSGFKSMALAANKTALYNAVDSIPAPSGSGHRYQGKEMMYEFFRYLTGQRLYNGHLGYDDFNIDNDHTTMDSSRDLTIELDPNTGAVNTDPNIAGQYVSPFNPATDQCAKIFTVSFMFQESINDSDSDDVLEGDKGSGGMEGCTLGSRGGHGGGGGGGGAAGATTDELNDVLYWMNNIDDLADGTWGSCPNVLGEQRVTSFFVTRGLPSDTTTQKVDGYASSGGTTSAYVWTGDNATTLLSSLRSILAEILSVSTTFTAASVPVSVLNRSQIVDNIYISLFQADDQGRTRWPGNVKKLKLDATNGLLLDASNTNAVGIDGRIKNDALTYWTDAANLPPPNPALNEVTGKDGRSVPRGGAGQKIPGFVGGDPGATNATSGARQLYYEPASAGDLLSTAPLDADSDTASALQSALGAADSAAALTLIKYARGYDVTDDDSDNNTSEARDWILGDSLHSRPLPINYGNTDTDNDPDIRILMGTNDGFMHMFKNTNPSTTGSQLGTEVWAFMPTEVMGVVEQLRGNLSAAHPYGVDGPPAAYMYDANNDGVISGADDKVWLYFGLRRGGKAYYGLDISNPDAPKKLWTITKGGDFGELGLTFSQPRIERLDWGSGQKPVVLFAGGYDVNKDTRKSADQADDDYTNAALGTDDSEGNAIYIVDAETGALVWKAVKGATAGYTAATKSYAHPDLTDSIPSTLTTLDTNADKLVDRIYVGDTGGNIWRVDTQGNDPSHWTIVKLASVGRHYNSSVEDDRRFFHRPDFVKFKDATGAYDAVIVGSGNRARPLDTLRHNYMYMIKDRNISSGTPPSTTLTHSSLGDVTNNCLQDGNCGTAPNLSSGWRLQLEATGEKVLATATTISKQIYFTTYTPSDVDAILAGNSCEPSEGSGRLFGVGLEDARAVNDYSVVNGTDVDKRDRYVDLKSGGIPAEVVYVPFDKILKPDLSIQEINTSARWKTYWYPVED